MKRSWFSRHPICFMALYLLFYLSAFNFLETRISMPHLVLVHCRLDDLIPFCKYAILPTGLDLRPYYVPGTDLFARAVRMLYRTDTATNVCPSIHVFNSVTLLLAYYRSHIFDAPRRRWMRPAADVLCFSIVCSTMLLKQHSCIDVVLGAALAFALDAAASSLERSGDVRRVPQRL